MKSGIICPGCSKKYSKFGITKHLTHKHNLTVTQARKVLKTGNMPPTKESVRVQDRPQIKDPEDFQVAYVYGFVQCWLQIYADSSGLSRAALARRVGGLLQVDAGRAPLRTTDRVRYL